MRIISKFKDYYDGVQAMGMDQELVYQRFTEALTMTLPESYENLVEELVKCEPAVVWETMDQARGYSLHPPLADMQCISIGFCGKVYPGIRFRHFRNHQVFKQDIAFEPTFAWEQINQLTNGPHPPFSRFYKTEDKAKKELATYFQNPLFQQDYTELFQRIEAPVFIAQDKQIRYWQSNNVPLALIKNPCLKELQFYRLFDAWQCFQELSRFLGGVLGKPDTLDSPLSEKCC